MSGVRMTQGGSKSRSARIAPGEALKTDPITPSYEHFITDFDCESELCCVHEQEPCLPSNNVSDVENGIRHAWWRGLTFWAGTKSKSQMKRPKDKKGESKHTAWAKRVYPPKASTSRRASASPRTGRCSKGKAGCGQVGSLDPAISLLDTHKIILRGSEAQDEEKRRAELQLLRRERTDKVSEMQAVQIALRKKHDAKLRKKILCKSKEESSKDSGDPVALAGQSMNSVGYLYSLSEQHVAEIQTHQVNNDMLEGNTKLLALRDDTKDGRASSASVETEASTAGELLQDTDDESYLPSVPGVSPEPLWPTTSAQARLSTPI